MALPRWCIGCVLLVFVGSLSGCSPDSLIGSRVDNFRAYYNTFYNAEQDFEDGLESVEERAYALDEDRFVAVFSTPDERVNEEAFESAISRSADILREHPQSKWVDNALMMIGQSYFYLGNHSGAAEKFEEVLALSDDRAGEAHFWKARTLVSQGDTEAASEYVRTHLEDDALEEPWRSKMWLVRAELDLHTGAWDQALAALYTGLQGEVPRTERYRAELLRAQVYETQGDYDEAATAYARAADAREYSVQLAGRIGEIRTLAYGSEDSDLVRRANLLARDDRHLEHRDRLRLLEAQVHAQQGRPAQARSAYNSLMHGAEPISGNLQGRAHYQLGTLYRDTWNDYEAAAAHFDSAATSVSIDLDERERARPHTALPDLNQLAQQYGAVAEPSAAIAHYDSLLTLGALSPEELESRIEEIAQTLAEAEEEADQQQQQTDRQQFQGRADSRDRGQQSELAVDAAEGDGGFLFHRNPQRVQEGQRSFRRQWGDRPRVRNWRIASRAFDAGDDDEEEPEVIADDLDEQMEERANGEGGGAADEVQETVAQEAEDVGLDLEAIPRTAVEQEAMRDERTWAWYELGNALFLNLSRPDSAIVWYERILEEAPEHPVRDRTRYAMAEALDAHGDVEAAADIYHALIEEDSTSVFALQARNRLGQSVEQAGVSEEDVHQQFAVARELGQQAEWEEALDQLARIARSHGSDEAIAPRTFWAMGQFYLSFYQQDSTQAHAYLDGLLAELEIEPADEPEETQETPQRTGAPQQVGQPEFAEPEEDAEDEQEEANASDTAEDSENDLEDEEADPEEQHPALYTLMQHISTVFPEAPHARRAQRVLDTLRDDEDPAAAEEPPDEEEREEDERDALPTPLPEPGGR